MYKDNTVQSKSVQATLGSPKTLRLSLDTVH